MTHNFDSLLLPTSLDEFLSAYYERLPLLVSRGQPRYFEDIISIESVGEYLGSGDVRHPGIRIVRSGEEVNPRNYTHSVPVSGILSADGTADKEKIFQRLHEGFTIILNSYERQSRGVLRLRHLAEQVFHSRVQANVYITPREAQGFKPHWDNHDVFILQFEGSKHWSVYDRVNPLPTKKELFDGVWTPVAPTLSATLEPGDILYVPKGYVHEARTTDHLSGHVTLGIMPYTYADLLREALSDIDESSEFRDALPPRFGGTEVLGDEFAQRLSRYVARLDVEAARRRLFARYVDTRPPDASERLQDYLRLPLLNDETRLRKRAAVFYELTCSDDCLSLRFNNKAVRLPSSVSAVVRQILEYESFTVGMLDLDEASRRLLAETLVREGFLTILHDHVAPSTA